MFSVEKFWTMFLHPNTNIQTIAFPHWLQLRKIKIVWQLRVTQRIRTVLGFWFCEVRLKRVSPIILPGKTERRHENSEWMNIILQEQNKCLVSHKDSKDISICKIDFSQQIHNNSDPRAAAELGPSETLRPAVLLVFISTYISSGRSELSSRERSCLNNCLTASTAMPVTERNSNQNSRLTPCSHKRWCELSCVFLLPFLFNIRKSRQWLCERERGWQGQLCDDWFTDLRLLPFFSFPSPRPPPLSRDSKVTKIYNQMAYDTLARKDSREPYDRTGRRGGGFGGTRLTSRCWPLLGRAVVCLYWKHDSKDTHASFSRQKVVKDGIWRLDLIDRHYMVKMEREDEKNDAFRAKLWRQTATQRSN